MNLKEHLKDFILDLEDDLTFEEIMAETMLETRTLRYSDPEDSDYNPNIKVWSKIRWSRYNDEERSNIRSHLIQAIRNLDSSLSSYDVDFLDMLAAKRNIGEEIIEGLKNAIEYAKGDTTKGKEILVVFNKE